MSVNLKTREQVPTFQMSVRLLIKKTWARCLYSSHAVWSHFQMFLIFPFFPGLAGRVNQFAVPSHPQLHHKNSRVVMCPPWYLDLLTLASPPPPPAILNNTFKLALTPLENSAIKINKRARTKIECKSCCRYCFLTNSLSKHHKLSKTS